jgi:hypothetical protein
VIESIRVIDPWTRRSSVKLVSDYSRPIDELIAVPTQRARLVTTLDWDDCSVDFVHAVWSNFSTPFNRSHNLLIRIPVGVNWVVS